jgi:hypothetical protein
MSKYSENEKRRLIERGIVRALLAHMRHKGWGVAAVYDGDGTHYPANDAATMAAVFNLDEVSVRFIRADKVQAFHATRDLRGANDWGPNGSAVYGVLLVLGNGEDIISDWNYSEGDPDGFNVAMDQFLAQDGESYGRDLGEVGRRAATDADRVAVLAGPWLREGDALAVLFKDRDGLRRIGEVLPGSLADANPLRKADVLLRAARLSAERLSIVEVDAYPGGWRKRAIVAHA